MVWSSPKSHLLQRSAQEPVTILSASTGKTAGTSVGKGHSTATDRRDISSAVRGVGLRTAEGRRGRVGGVAAGQQRHAHRQRGGKCRQHSDDRVVGQERGSALLNGDPGAARDGGRGELTTGRGFSPLAAGRPAAWRRCTHRAADSSVVESFHKLNPALEPVAAQLSAAHTKRQAPDACFAHIMASQEPLQPCCGKGTGRGSTPLVDLPWRQRGHSTRQRAVRGVSWYRVMTSVSQLHVQSSGECSCAADSNQLCRPTVGTPWHRTVEQGCRGSCSD